MAKVTPGTARAAALVGFLILLCGIAISTCGFVWIAYGGYLGHGLWSGIPMLVVALMGFLSLTRNNIAFTLYVILCILTCIAAGIQAVAAGLELQHWSKFMGERKCSVTDGVCRCMEEESIRIHDLDSCDKIPSINYIFITLIVFSIIGSLLCLGGAIAGCVGLATVPRSSPSTLPRKQKQKPAIEVSYQQNSYPPRRAEPYQNEKKGLDARLGNDHYDGDYPGDYDRKRNVDIGYGDYDRDRRYDDYKRDIDRSDRDRGSDYYKDNISDHDSYYDRNYDRDYARDYDRDYDRDYYRDYDYDDDRRSYEDRRTPPPDDKTYL